VQRVNLLSEALTGFLSDLIKDPGLLTFVRGGHSIFLALGLLLLAEFSFVLWLQGQTLGQYFATRDPVSRAVYAAMLILFSAMPRWWTEDEGTMFRRGGMGRTQKGLEWHQLSHVAKKEVTMQTHLHLFRLMAMVLLAAIPSLAENLLTGKLKGAFEDKSEYELRAKLLAISEWSTARPAEIGLKTEVLEGAL
jgi:hypothetical protein